MAFLGGTFDATQVQPSSGYEVLPAGEYKIVIVDSVMETTKAGNGQFLKLQMSVLDGPHQGATLFDRLNLVNPNQTAMDIAQRTLSAICHAVGMMQIQDSAQLHNRPLIARVTLKGGDGQYGPSNEIKAYKPIGQQQAPTPAPAATTQSAPVANAAPAGVPPWMAGKAA
ncbi:MAG: DUF669 domain-containing protein [Gammaproteobacteria bacterium]|nr:DUF669 domain-containing protein [Gammaproteobacteria bacterium]